VDQLVNFLRLLLKDGTDGPAAEADGTGETDWIPVPSVPSWFRETGLEGTSLHWCIIY